MGLQVLIPVHVFVCHQSRGLLRVFWTQPEAPQTGTVAGMFMEKLNDRQALKVTLT
jgi:hypothetical protein